MFFCVRAYLKKIQLRRGCLLRQLTLLVGKFSHFKNGAGEASASPTGNQSWQNGLTTQLHYRHVLQLPAQNSGSELARNRPSHALATPRESGHCSTL